MLRHLLALVAPPACLACGAGIAAGASLCSACRADLPWLGRTCARCALPLPCGSRCPAAGAPFAAAWAPLAHDGAARALVVALKFRGRLAAADVMAAQIAANAPPALLAGIDALVPVPPQRQRRRARGFDHAELIARALARRIGVPARRALERRGRARQLGAGRAQRLGARLEVAAPRPVAGRVALVDDVHTTGATLSACAAALRAAGAEEVVAATYARALG